MVKSRFGFRSAVCAAVALSLASAGCGNVSTRETSAKPQWVPAYYVLVVISTGVTIASMIDSFQKCMKQREQIIAEHPQYAMDLSCQQKSFRGG